MPRGPLHAGPDRLNWHIVIIGYLFFTLTGLHPVRDSLDDTVTLVHSWYPADAAGSAPREPLVDRFH